MGCPAVILILRASLNPPPIVLYYFIHYHRIWGKNIMLGQWPELQTIRVCNSANKLYLRIYSVHDSRVSPCYFLSCVQRRWCDGNDAGG